MNAWTFDQEDSILKCLLSYSRLTDSYTKNLSLDREKNPKYFKFLKENKIIVSNDAVREQVNEELLDSYLLPLGIKSMIDVPLRSGAVMIGVICFEQVEEAREWSGEEQKFALSVAQLVSLALESEKNRKYREKLEELITEKDLLLSEINHRVKNNISIILSLINLQKGKVRDEFHEALFEEIKNKVFSISAVQEQLHSSEYFDKIDIRLYLNELVENLKNSFVMERKPKVVLNLESVFVNITKAIPLGLITNELVTNSFKYAFEESNEDPTLWVSFVQLEEEVILTVKDNGAGMSESTERGMGLDIVESLCEQIDADLIQKNAFGLETKVAFRLD